MVFICFSSCHVILTERVSGGRRVWGIGCRREGTREERATNQARDGRRGRRGRGGEPQRRQGRRRRYRQQQPAISVLIFTLNDLFSFSSSWSPSPYLIPHPPVITRQLRSGISPGTQSLARTKPIYSKKKAHPAQKFEKDKISNHVVCPSSW